MQILYNFSSVTQNKYKDLTFPLEVSPKEDTSQILESRYNYNIQIQNYQFAEPTNSSFYNTELQNRYENKIKPFLIQQAEIPLNEQYAIEPQNLDMEDQEIKFFQRDEWRIEYGDYISTEQLNDIPKRKFEIKDFFIRFKKVFFYIGLTSTLALLVIQYLLNIK